MLASTPPPTFPNPSRDKSMSPSCRNPHLSRRPSVFESPVHTSSPLRQQPRLSVQPPSIHASLTDKYLQSPFRTPISYTSAQPMLVDDSGFDSPFNSPLLDLSSSRTLYTPVKQPRRSFDEFEPDDSFGSPFTYTPKRPPSAAGLKRKSPSTHRTPLRAHTLTPLKTVSSGGSNGRLSDTKFDRLAPLSPPKFHARTPQTKKETEAHIRSQTATMTQLRISDMEESDGSGSETDNDSGCDLAADQSETQEDALFLGGQALKNSTSIFNKALRREGLVKDEEVAEAISPGGHITKRRARRRPLSDELLESVRDLPSSGASTSGSKNILAFPSCSNQRRSPSCSPSSSECGSPAPPRLRLSGQPPSQPPCSHSHQRAPFARVDSATFFFGPLVSDTASPPSGFRQRASASISSNNATDLNLSPVSRPKMMNRHSYAGSGSSQAWTSIQSRSSATSPQSSPTHVTGDTEHYETEDDDEMMVDVEEDVELPANSSFNFSLTEDTFSPPRRSGRPSDAISKKCGTRDSGIVVSDDEDGMLTFSGGSTSNSSDHLSVMPGASTSVGSIYSDGDDEDGLVTPGVGPRSLSGWPDAIIVNGDEDSSSVPNGQDVDAFILRTLAAASKAVPEVKKAPGTPVKKAKISYMSGKRPWQSAVAHKVGLGIEDKKGKAPRKSMPAVFPPLGRRSGRLGDTTDSDSDCDESPSNRKDKYLGIGLGRPTVPSPKNGVSRTRWLMRRSSSGAFSSSSESMSVMGTPTRSQGTDTLRPPSKLASQFSPSKNRLKISPARSTSSSSTSSVTTLNSPTTSLRTLPISGKSKNHGSDLVRTRRQSQPSYEQERTGRFEREFVEIAELGSGEFGKVIKVRTKNGNSDELYAVKKSKRFEGAKHRLRLREEVDTLRHLSEANGGQRHPNVLAFIDAWEEDEHLFICTELCEWGNFAHFLWEYGRVYPRLDEARVWKIIVDLSNGLRFIHDSGVIHLDLKPANIFVTGQGRFKIGDFGMSSLWPRRPGPGSGSFEREGDKLYLAPEVLQGKYGKAADIFSFGMTILETASNIVVPDQGEAWHRLRQEDFSQVDLDRSPELLRLIRQMMRTEPTRRVDIHDVYEHPVVARARARMEQTYLAAKEAGTSVFAASPLASVTEGFLEDILDL
ncbi:hypothetical protein K435DRAFT_775597 [Dendrothele bispora CBS 962.96]|uniref:Protein kinase domain-containing protein n=1 Tax=Dendrothele bispora (strain CBS 962.96) TaxID=1314807 RepID=A0A4S8MI50_DENBC|nr:hypothetical protein K435DRAFT_775597 [Dendrothele bispora CBS 962.96]